MEPEDVDENKEIIISARERGPGPGRYALPSTCGDEAHDATKHKKPSYSFGRRFKLSSFICSPGPCYSINPHITRNGRDGTPVYSMLSRQKEINEFKTPAPGCYHPEKVHPPGERHSCKYSMGFRTRCRKRDLNPASNVYALPPVMGSTQANKQSYPSWSMTGRSHARNFAEDLAKTPGPGQYNAVQPNVMRNQAPRYSLLGRNHMPGDGTVKPGPGAHRPEVVDLNKPAAPKHSLGIRHSEFVTPLIMECKD
ncbi:unnamed protein product [Owenia fusiformis]|uniref:Uncharacterized protein n=1 Tax=Owenia fusiformis TaxID=6347 RepID=A0A8J1XUD3_OWEFU|nr:unnamed protein product [Owenia fusiformis]